ncbi:SHOCT domain-containing protein [Nocardia tengchongensis]|uniref:SHOCT domain-containing protein n=1 Tax=Nocardia tengchongensis TaxID=2055889 RepID=UPI0033CE13E3
MSVWDVFWLILTTMAFVAYLMLLFMIVSDLFRDRETSGWVKALWVVALFIFPFITALVYLIVRGSGMAERQATDYKKIQDAQVSYIKEAAGTNAAAQISEAKKLLDDGTISATEFEQLKAKALA